MYRPLTTKSLILLALAVAAVVAQDECENVVNTNPDVQQCVMDMIEMHKEDIEQYYADYEANGRNLEAAQEYFCHGVADMFTCISMYVDCDDYVREKFADETLMQDLSGQIGDLGLDMQSCSFFEELNGEEEEESLECSEENIATNDEVGECVQGALDFHADDLEKYYTDLAVNGPDPETAQEYFCHAMEEMAMCAGVTLDRCDVHFKSRFTDPAVVAELEEIGLDIKSCDIYDTVMEIYDYYEGGEEEQEEAEAEGGEEEQEEAEAEAVSEAEAA